MKFHSIMTKTSNLHTNLDIYKHYIPQGFVYYDVNLHTNLDIYKLLNDISFPPFFLNLHTNLDIYKHVLVDTINLIKKLFTY